MSDFGCLMWFQNLEAAEHTLSRNESNSLFKCIKVSCSFSLCDPFLCEFCFVFCNSQSCVSLSTIFETFICICGIHWKMSNWQFFMCFAHQTGPCILHLQHALPPNEKALNSGYLAPVVFLWAWKEMVSLGAREQEWCKSLQDLHVKKGLQISYKSQQHQHSMVSSIIMESPQISKL